MTRQGLPVPYLLVVGVLIILGILVALVSFGVPPFDNLATFIVTMNITVLGYMVFGILGGLFVGMVLAHRALANREFTPFERQVLVALGDIRDRLDALEREREEKKDVVDPLRR